MPKRRIPAAGAVPAAAAVQVPGGLAEEDLGGKKVVPAATGKKVDPVATAKAAAAKAEAKAQKAAEKAKAAQAAAVAIAANPSAAPVKVAAAATVPIYVPDTISISAIKDLWKIVGPKTKMEGNVKVVDANPPQNLLSQTLKTIREATGAKEAKMRRKLDAAGNPIPLTTDASGKVTAYVMEDSGKEINTKKDTPVSQWPYENKFWMAYKTTANKPCVSLATDAAEYLTWYLESQITPEVASSICMNAWYASKRLTDMTVAPKLRKVKKGEEKKFDIVDRPPRVPAGGMMNARAPKAGSKSAPKAPGAKQNALILLDWAGRSEYSMFDAANQLMPKSTGDDAYLVFTGSNAGWREGARMIKGKNKVGKPGMVVSPGFLGDFSLVPSGALELFINKLAPKVKFGSQEIPLSVSLSSGVSGQAQIAGTKMVKSKDAKGKEIQVSRKLSVSDELAQLKSDWEATLILSPKVIPATKAGEKPTTEVSYKIKPGQEKASAAARLAYISRLTDVSKAQLASSTAHGINKIYVDVTRAIAAKAGSFMNTPTTTLEVMKKAIDAVEREFAIIHKDTLPEATGQDVAKKPRRAIVSLAKY